MLLSVSDFQPAQDPNDLDKWLALAEIWGQRVVIFAALRGSEEPSKYLGKINETLHWIHHHKDEIQQILIDNSRLDQGQELLSVFRLHIYFRRLIEGPEGFLPYPATADNPCFELVLQASQPKNQGPWASALFDSNYRLITHMDAQSYPADLFELARETDRKESFLAFVAALRDDYIDNGAAWKNATLDTFLDAIHAWIKENQIGILDSWLDGHGNGDPSKDVPNWRDIAALLYLGRVFDRETMAL